MVAAQPIRYVRPRFSPVKTDEASSIRSVIDLILFNAANNPEHCFCLQAEMRTDNADLDVTEPLYNVRQISFKDLYLALQNCCSWLKASGIINGQISSSRKQNPVAVYLESDITLFLYVVALMSLNCPVRLVSLTITSCIAHAFVGVVAVGKVKLDECWSPC